VGFSELFLPVIKVIRRAARLGRRLFLPLVGCSYLPLHDKKSTAFVIPVLGSVLVLSVFTASAAEIQLSSDSEIATAGFYQLRWQRDGAGAGGDWQLQESRQAGLQDYKVIYRGPDLARVISGKHDGDYFYRVTSADTPGKEASNIVKVTVAHHPLKNAFLFFAVGAAVFLAILVSIITGNRRHTGR
jgi:hypothetical protein